MPVDLADTTTSIKEADTVYQLRHYSLSINSGVDCALVAPALSHHKIISDDAKKSDCDLRLLVKRDEKNHYHKPGLVLQWHRESDTTLNFTIDISSLINQHRTYPIAKQGPLNQALGKKSKGIIDATGGWGADALLMALQGYRVTVLERQPVMALLLQDAFKRFAELEWVQRNHVVVPRVLFADAHTVFTSGTLTTDMNIDCVYFDPMFPPKRKKSAAVNKQMQLLQWLVGEDSDAERVLSSARQAAVPRVVVKRPSYAPSLLDEPSQRFASKLVNYDVYLKA